MGYRSIAATVLASALVVWSAPASEAGSICRDGTYSPSTGRGTCSYHQGVLRPATAAEDAARAPLAPTTPTPAPSASAPEESSPDPSANPDPVDDVTTTPDSSTTTTSGSTTRVLRIAQGLPTRREVGTGYSRSLFRHWVSTNGCDTRQWVLIAESVGGRQSGCTMVGATWVSQYDGVRTSNASSFDIDHFVPLKEAWDSGANRWSAAKRQAFANDLGYARSLIAVSASSNRSKSDQDPAQWLPSSSAFRCTYVVTWVAVKYRWGLAMDAAEKRAVEQVLSSCSGSSIRLPEVA